MLPRSPSGSSISGYDSELEEFARADVPKPDRADEPKYVYRCYASVHDAIRALGQAFLDLECRPGDDADDDKFVAFYYKYLEVASYLLAIDASRVEVLSKSRQAKGLLPLQRPDAGHLLPVSIQFFFDAYKDDPDTFMRFYGLFSRPSKLDPRKRDPAPFDTLFPTIFLHIRHTSVAYAMARFESVCSFLSSPGSSPTLNLKEQKSVSECDTYDPDVNAASCRHYVKVKIEEATRNGLAFMVAMMRVGRQLDQLNVPGQFDDDALKFVNYNIIALKREIEKDQPASVQAAVERAKRLDLINEAQLKVVSLYKLHKLPLGDIPNSESVFHTVFNGTLHLPRLFIESGGDINIDVATSFIDEFKRYTDKFLVNEGGVFSCSQRSVFYRLSYGAFKHAVLECKHSILTEVSSPLFNNQDHAQHVRKLSADLKKYFVLLSKIGHRLLSMHYKSSQEDRAVDRLQCRALLCLARKKVCNAFMKYSQWNNDWIRDDLRNSWLADQTADVILEHVNIMHDTVAYVRRLLNDLDSSILRLDLEASVPLRTREERSVDMPLAYEGYQKFLASVFSFLGKREIDSQPQDEINISLAKERLKRESADMAAFAGKRILSTRYSQHFLLEYLGALPWVHAFEDTFSAIDNRHNIEYASVIAALFLLYAMIALTLWVLTFGVQLLRFSGLCLAHGLAMTSNAILLSGLTPIALILEGASLMLFSVFAPCKTFRKCLMQTQKEKKYSILYACLGALCIATLLAVFVWYCLAPLLPVIAAFSPLFLIATKCHFMPSFISRIKDLYDVVRPFAGHLSPALDVSLKIPGQASLAAGLFAVKAAEVSVTSLVSKVSQFDANRISRLELEQKNAFREKIDQTAISNRV